MNLKEQINDILRDLSSYKNFEFLKQDDKFLLYSVSFDHSTEFFSFSETENNILSVVFCPEFNYVQARHFSKKTFDMVSFTDYSDFIFDSGFYRIELFKNSALPVLDEVKDIFSVDLSFSQGIIKVPATLDNIIKKFDPDIEGIEPVEPNERNKKARYESAKKSYFDSFEVVAPVYESGKRILEVFSALLAERRVLVPVVVRNLKFIKKFLDDNNIDYLTEKKLNDALVYLENRFDEKGIVYYFMPSKDV